MPRPPRCQPRLGSPQTSSRSTLATTLSTVKPKCLARSLHGRRGAEALLAEHVAARRPPSCASRIGDAASIARRGAHGGRQHGARGTPRPGRRRAPRTGSSRPARRCPRPPSVFWPLRAPGRPPSRWRSGAASGALPAVGVGEHVGAARHALAASARRLRQDRQLLAGERQRGRPAAVARARSRHAATVSLASAGRSTVRSGIARRASELRRSAGASGRPRRGRSSRG